MTALVAYSLLNPTSKWAATRAWHAKTLPGEMGVERLSENVEYIAMDWLVGRTNRIEGKLAARTFGRARACCSI
jgi:hypothetical protein